ncbi:MAG: OmpA family protein [Proteobacteria bacterium]|nr:OmpA family protein [Pseudomonadota bacterium]
MLTLVLAMMANAQTVGDVPDMNAQLWRPSIDAQRTMWADDASRGPHGWATGRLYAGYVHGPMGAVFFDGTKQQVLGDVVGLNLTGGVQLGPVRVGADVPVYLLATSDWEGLGGAGLGDAAIDLKATLLDPAKAPLGIALGGRFDLPTATVNVPLGASNPMVEIQGIFDKEVGDLLIALNLGARIGPNVVQDNIELNDSFMSRLGLGYAITESAGASLDFQLLKDFSQPAKDENGDPSLVGMPVEGILGGWGRVSDNVVLRGGVGTGFTEGIGSPAFRAIFSVGYEPVRDRDRDLDGLADSIDACPEDPEDKDKFEDLDGCPDLDNDGDGLLDVADSCPMEPEDPDDWQDEDGCPDPRTLVRVAIVDPNGRSIQGVQAMVALGEADAKMGNASFEVELEPGEYGIQATAEGYDAMKATFTVPEGPPIDVEQVMQPTVVFGEIVARIQDKDGNPVEGRVASSEKDSFATTDGAAELSMMEGRYALTASAEGYFEAVQNVEVVPGETSEIVFTLDRAVGTVTVTVVDAEGAAIEGATYAFGEEAEEQAVSGKSTEAEVDPGDYVVIARAEGYAPAKAEVKVNAGAESAVTLTLSPTKVKVSLEKIEILDKVFFDTGRDTIKSQSFALLDEVSQILVDRQDILKIRIEGHTDSRGSEGSNQRLSERRAASVRKYLIEHGVAEGRLTSVGLGESQPIDTAENEAAWSQNRRVEFVIEEWAEDE